MWTVPETVPAFRSYGVRHSGCGGSAADGSIRLLLKDMTGEYRIRFPIRILHVGD